MKQNRASCTGKTGKGAKQGKVAYLVNIENNIKGGKAGKWRQKPIKRKETGESTQKNVEKQQKSKKIENKRRIL